MYYGKELGRFLYNRFK